MITSKSKAIEIDCRSLFVYIRLLCDCTRIIWTLAFEGFRFKKQPHVHRRRYVWHFDPLNIRATTNK